MRANWCVEPLEPTLARPFSQAAYGLGRPREIDIRHDVAERGGICRRGPGRTKYWTPSCIVNGEFDTTINADIESHFG